MVITALMDRYIVAVQQADWFAERGFIVAATIETELDAVMVLVCAFDAMKETLKTDG